METVVMSFCGLCLLLVLGKIVRTAIPLFQRLYLPASVIGGLIGLLWINTFGKPRSYGLPSGTAAGAHCRDS